MDVKQAVAQAKAYVKELFAKEQPANMLLEEVEFDDRNNEWLITLGYTRPWHSSQNRLADAPGLRDPQRFYTVVCLADDSGKLVSVKNQENEH